MSTCSTAKRRRKQARKGWSHLPPLRRPKLRKKKGAN